MLAERYPYYLANRPHAPNAHLAVRDKYTGASPAAVAKADAAVLDEAIAAAARAAEPMRRMPGWRRQQVLDHVVRRVEARAEELAYALCVEAGKPLRFSRGEVTRLADTLRVAAEESVRVGGEVMPLDISPRTERYRGMWKRVPVGACGLITPFNFPLNLVAHKIGPALAMGCPFVLKPAANTPIGALLIGEILAETELPEGAFSILPMDSSQAGALVEDERLRLLSFTGSAEVGWKLKARAGKKKVGLELGGNAATVVDETCDLDDAVQRVLFGAFYQSGQSCISVQRVLVHEDAYETFRDALVRGAEALEVGDPKDEGTFIGPVITEQDAERIVTWVREATQAGGLLLCGGERDGAMVQPTLVEHVPHDQKLVREEVFGPAAVLEPWRDFDEALAKVNDSRYGLQAGLFTRDLYRAQRAWDELDVGGVIIGDVPSWRVDHMPYGGVKDSGTGREGVRFAMDEMSEIRLMAVRA